MEHYNQLVDTTIRDLCDIEEDLRSRPPSDKEAIDSSTIQAELKEDDLRSELERTRNQKLTKLKQPGPSQLTPVWKAKLKPSKGSSEKRRHTVVHPYFHRLQPAHGRRPAAPAHSGSTPQHPQPFPLLPQPQFAALHACVPPACPPVPPHSGHPSYLFLQPSPLPGPSTPSDAAGAYPAAMNVCRNLHDSH